jgi:hypothetical protein
MIRKTIQVDIASTKAESTTAESVIRPKQLVRVEIRLPKTFSVLYLLLLLLHPRYRAEHVFV